MEIENIVDLQKDFFSTQATRLLEYRLEALIKLKNAIRRHEQDILMALQADLGKQSLESLVTELGIVFQEIDIAYINTKKWMRRIHTPTPITNFLSKSFIYPEPMGSVFIISPWNYPFYLAVSPLISAICAGNCVVLKPSELSIHTGPLLKCIIEETFDANYIHVELGGAETVHALMHDGFDSVFFTGSQAVGKAIMHEAAKSLTPVTLELGGKCPCIVDQSADIELAAKRIAWGKFVNCGQTCVAPDYVFIHENHYQDFLGYMILCIEKMYGKRPMASPDYGRIVNERHLERLVAYLNQGELLYGGEYDEQALKMAPTLILAAKNSQPIMSDEIFGPILPILTFQYLDDVFYYINQNPTPLAAYLFTEDSQVKRQFVKTVDCGGVCINDTIMHMGNPHLPFGGMRSSGMGSYHGKAGFNTFTHYKSVLEKSTLLDLNYRYPPSSSKKIGLLKRFIGLD